MSTIGPPPCTATQHKVRSWTLRPPIRPVEHAVIHGFSAAGWVGEEREKFRPAVLGYSDGPPMTGE
jgi:hypothetical protein